MKEETSDTLLLLQYVPLPWQDAFFFCRGLRLTINITMCQKQPFHVFP